MILFDRNHSWLVALGAMLTLLWTAQLTGNWYKPHSDIQLVQHKKVELAHTTQFERHDNGRAFRLEAKPDPIALHPGISSLADCEPGLQLDPACSTENIHFQYARPPAIRAPPSLVLPT
jgi:hypothetical protein